ncbi:MAG: type II toxin-antitoxin system Phd/YefM family antitoxin [Rhodomicrobium sp.]
MPTYTVHAAKTHLSKLIESAERGEEVIIARGNKPVVRLVPVSEPAKRKSGRRPGAYKDELTAFPDSFFFDPLDEEELRLWEGEGHDADPLR